MSQLRPESRISSLEKRTTAIEASIEELSSDTGEELNAIRQDLKQLNSDMKASFLQIGDAFTLNANTIEAVKQDLAALKLQIGDAFTLNANTIEAVKQDLAALKAAQEARFDKLEATQAEILALLKQNRPDK